MALFNYCIITVSAAFAATFTFAVFSYSFIVLNVNSNYMEWFDALQIVHFRSLDKPKEEDFSLEL